jgi:hypothetical protein
MRKFIFLAGGGAVLAACGQSAEDVSSNAAANAAAVEKPRPAYCFFKDPETKNWKVTADKDGNVVVSGQVYREDARYKAVFGPPTLSGSVAEIAPTIAQNDTGYAAPEDWWDIKTTIPASAAVTTVNVKCGEKTLASLQVPRKG